MAARRSTGKRAAPDREPILRATWLEVIENLGSGPRLVIGGKSMGGRIASLIADEAGAKGLVCLGYPFHPPGRPELQRVEHLRKLRTPTLIVQGTRDSPGSRAEVSGYDLSPKIGIAWSEEGDHSNHPNAQAGVRSKTWRKRSLQLESSSPPCAFIEDKASAPEDGPAEHETARSSPRTWPEGQIMLYGCRRKQQLREGFRAPSRAWERLHIALQRSRFAHERCHNAQDRFRVIPALKLVHHGLIHWNETIIKM
jgi:hypothetical protein